MTDTLTITVDDTQVQRWFGELIRRGSDMSGLMVEIGENLLRTTQSRFSLGISPDGVAWAPVKRGGKPLLVTGRMRDDISPSSGPDWVELSAHAKQARWHQEGTDPYVILPKNGKALAFGPPASRLAGKNKGKVGPAYVVKKVNHPGLVARPFLGVSDEDGQLIEQLAIAWLDLSAETGTP